MSGHSKWNNIQHRKGAQDKKRAKLFTKFGRELTIAAKEGGSDPNFNPRLRLAIEKAKAGNMPKDILERAIGAVSWMFKKKGIITVKSEGIDMDEFMMAALEAGAEDVEETDGVFEVTTEYTEFQTVLENLKNAGYQYEDAEITMIPENTVEITDLETAKKCLLKLRYFR